MAARSSTGTPHPVAPRSCARRWLMRLLLLGGSLLIACLLGVIALEIYLRQTMGDFFAPVANLRGLYEIDDQGWTRPVPGHVLEVAEHGVHTTVHLNSLGLRGGEVPPRTQESQRVLTLGDSMVFGYGVNDGETFTALMEEQLRTQLSTPIVARSGGAPDYGTVDQLHVLRHVLDSYDPDLVVVAVFLGNDFSDNFVDARTVVDGYMISGPIAKIAQDSTRIRLALQFRVCFAVEDYLRQNYPDWSVDIPAPEPNALTPFASRTFMGLFMDAVEETPELGAVLDHTVDSLAAIAGRVGPTPVLVVLLPCPSRSDAAAYRRDLVAHGLSPETHRLGTVQRRLATRCAELSLPVVDLSPAFLAHANTAELFLTPPDFHYSPAGHRLVAEHLTPAVASMLKR